MDYLAIGIAIFAYSWAYPVVKIVNCGLYNFTPALQVPSSAASDNECLNGHSDSAFNDCNDERVSRTRVFIGYKC